LLEFAEELLLAGATLLQYRSKSSSARISLDQASDLKRLAGARATLIMNDRPPDAVRRLIGPGLWLGASTHNPGQLQKASELPVDYVAIGPVFPTSSKDNPDPVVGLDGVRRSRQLTRKTLVAIGGITRSNCRQVLDAGADSVAVIADLLATPRKSAEEFFRVLR
jgi:thiamine-phosphate pyrophosphorylase